MFGVELGRFTGVMRRVLRVALGGVRVVRCAFVIAGFVVLSGFAVMACCAFVMLCCLVVMVRCFLRHVDLH